MRVEQEGCCRRSVLPLLLLLLVLLPVTGTTAEQAEG